MHRPDPFSAWFSAGADIWLLGLEAATVIGLRGIKIAQGGSAAQAETQRMIGEKFATLVELQRMAFAGELGVTVSDAVGNTVAHYRRAVRANRRRLTR